MNIDLKDTIVFVPHNRDKNMYFLNLNTSVDIYITGKSQWFVYPLLYFKVHVFAVNIVTDITFIDLRCGKI